MAGIFLSIILLYFNSKKYRSAFYLGGFFFLISFYGFLQYVLVSSKSVILVSICIANPVFLTYLIGPMLYWYVRSILTDDSRLRKRDLWHLLPSLVFLISVIPYLVTPWSVKMENATLLIADIGNLKFLKTTVLYNFLPHAIVFMSRPLLVLIYAIASSILFIRWYCQHRNDDVLSQQRYMSQWLIVLLGFLFILVISYLMAMVEAYLLGNLKLFFTLTFLQLFSGIGLTGLLIAPFFFPSILYGMPRIPVVNLPDHKPHRAGHPGDLSETGRRKPEYEAGYLQLIREKVDRCMVELQPYLQPDCNLAYLSQLTGIPAHHLAYYFREEQKQPFNEYRNEWRVKHAKKLILEGKTKELTLEAIGLLSGFSTRNTFYTSFKKAEGISPSSFLSQVTLPV